MLAGWKSVTAGQLASERTGSVDPAKFPDEIFDLYSIPSYDTREPEVLAGREIGSSKKVVKEGDILISKIVPHIRRVWIVGPNRGRRQIASGEWISFSDDGICPDYLRYFLLSDGFHSKFMSTITGVGGSLLRARPSEVSKIAIPLPPLATQQHIARVLEQADQLRKQAQQMESELNQLAQSLFLEMFGDPVTNPKKWPLYQLSDIASVQLGKMLSEKAKTGASPKKYLRNANVRWRNIELDDLLEMDFSEREMKKFELQYGDLLVCEGGEVGRCAIWHNQLSDCYYQKALHRVRVKESMVTPEYLQEYFYWMATLGGLTSSVSEVTFSHLTAERLNILKVPLPPLEMQVQYTNKVALIEKQRQQVVKLSQKYEDTFNSLMQRAFNGELTAPERKAA